MTIRVTIPNLSDVLSGVQRKAAQIDMAVAQAIQITGLAVERQAKQNASSMVRVLPMKKPYALKLMAKTSTYA